MPTRRSGLVTRPVDELLGDHPGYGFAGLSVSTAIGNFTHYAIDLGFPAALLGLLDYARTYNSLGGTGHPLGRGWSSSFSAQLSAAEKGGLHQTTGPVNFHDDDGRVLAFTPRPDGGYERPQDLAADLTRHDDGFTLDLYDTGAAWQFDQNGRHTGRSQEGHTLSFDYDGEGRLLRATHSAGPQLNLSYDGQGRLVRAEADDGRSVSYAYGDDGALATVTGPAGEVSRYTWSQGQLATFTDPDGNELAGNTYNDQGRVSGQELPTGGSVEFGYDTATGVTTVTSHPAEAVMTFTADPSGRLAKLDDPAGNTTTFGYDEHGYLSEAHSPEGTVLSQRHDDRGHLLESDYGGATTSYTYDDQNRVASVEDPVGGTVHYTYSGNTHVPADVSDQVGATTRFTSIGGRIRTMTDADGNTTTYDYDATGNLIAVTDAAGGVTRYTYDRAGRRTSQITPSGAETRWEYDAAGHPTATIDPAGNTTRYRYSAAGRLLESTDPTGASTHYTYDKAGQLATVTDPLGRTTRYGYDAHGNLTSTTAPNGSVSRTEYDNRGRVTATTDPTGAVTKYAYDKDGNLTEVTDPLDHVTRRKYDARGNLTEVTDPAGAVTRYTYDAADRQISLTDPNGGLWRTEYDAAGHIVATTDPAGAVSRQRWTPAGKLAASIDPLGRETRYAYSPTSRPVSVANPQGGATRYAYDPDGRRVSITTPAGLLTQYRYDIAGRMVARVDPRGWITQYEYNARGQQTAVISPSGAVTRSRYDPASQLVETIDPNGSPTVFGYDPAGHLIEATDAKGAIRRFDYDPAGRQKSFTDPLDRITTRAYDANGNLTTITDPSGHAQQFHYDAAKRLLRQSADDGTEVSFSYDPGGRRTSMTDGTGTTHYGYDSANRLLIVTDPAGGTTTASYDAAGQHTSFSYPDGLRLTYQYDRNGHLIFLHDSRAGRAAYVLDPDGRLITEELPRRFARRYHYDQGLLRRYAVFHNDRLVSVTDLGYDPDGRIAAERADADQRTYRYDPAGQLVSARHWRRHPWPWETDEESSAPWSHDRSGIALPEPGHWREHRADAQHWDYDVVGNRTRARRGDSITHYRYDVADQLIVRESHGLRTEYSYDTSGRLTEESIGEHCHRTSYDGFGRPVRITQHGQRPAQRTDLTYTGDNLLALLERTNTDADRDEERAASVRYRWSTESIPQILSQSALPRLDDADRDRPGRLDADFTYGYGRTFASWEHGTATFHTDVLGSNIHTEDTEPWVLAATHYDPFGSPDVRDEDDRERHGRSSHFREDVERPLLPPELPRFGYRGELAIGSDGSLLYLRARTYNTRLGRFTTPDPMAQMARPVAAVSPYAYADNNPINQSDPMGLWSIGSLVSSAVHGAQHLASSVVHGAQHVANAVSGAVTHAAQVVAGAASHAFHAVVTGLANIANTARKDAGIVFHAVAGAARRVVHAVGDAVSRTVGIATHAVSATVNWVKKHNQILGKIGSVLSNVSGALALAGLLIAPIPGLDFLTPILEGGAALTALGAVGFQGVARAAGDTDITYGDLLGDALGVIPGGGDAKEAVEGVDLAKLAADGSAGEARTFHTVQSAEDAARLRSGGDPWPMEAERAALGPGVYAFDNRESAEAYAQLLGGHGASNLEIMSFSVSEHALSSMRSLNIDSLPDPDLFMSKYSRLWGAIPNHGYDWLMRGTRFGTEHYFSNNVFDLLRFSGGR